MLLRLAVVAGLVAADLWSKAAAFRWLEDHPERLAFDRHGHPRLEILGSWLTFMRSSNYGMAWGFDRLPPLVLVGGRTAAVLFLAWLVVRTSPARRLLSAALVLILAGALGNLYDNLFMPRAPERPFGPVRDFIDVYFSRWDWHFPTFNVADSCITVGAVLLFASGLFGGKHKSSSPGTP